jgi:amino acid transporter
MKWLTYLVILIVILVVIFVELPEWVDYIFLGIFIFGIVSYTHKVDDLKERMKDVETSATASRRDTYSNYEMISELSSEFKSKPKKKSKPTIKK